jgi:hypothetical protein
LVLVAFFACLVPSIASAQTTVQGQIIIQEQTPTTSTAPPPQAQAYGQPVMVTPTPPMATPPQPQCPAGSVMQVDAYGRPQCMVETTRHRVSGGLLGGGIGLFAGFWVASIVTGLVEGVALSFGCAFSSGCSAGSPGDVIAWGFVPLIGPLVQLAYFPGVTDSGLYAWHIVESAVQIGGLVMLIFGAIGEDVTELTPVGATYAMHLRPIATPTTAGLSFDVTF